jgi:hypothetical protein
MNNSICSTPNTTCLLGHTGPLCLNCDVANNFVKNTAGFCMKCDSDATIYLKLIGIAAYLFVMVVLNISSLHKKYMEKRQIKTLAMLFR